MTESLIYYLIPTILVIWLSVLFVIVKRQITKQQRRYAPVPRRFRRRLGDVWVRFETAHRH